MSALIKYEMDNDEYTFYMNIEILKEYEQNKIIKTVLKFWSK